MSRAHVFAFLALGAACAEPAAPVAPPRPTYVSDGLVGDLPPAATSVHLPSGVVPTAYALDLDIDPRAARFSGRARIALRIDAPTDEIVIHGRDLTIRDAKIVVGGTSLPLKVFPRRAFGDKEHDEELFLLAPKRLAPGAAELDVAYEAPFGTLWGLFKVVEGDRSFAFTQLESTFARRMFPSFDEPRHKTPFSLTLTVPDGMKGFANTRAVREEPAGSGKRRITFEPSKPIPTYLVAVAVGDLEVLDGPAKPAPIRLLAAPGRAKLGAAGVEAAQKTLASLEAYFGRPYHYGKLDVVAVPNFAVGAMENAGLVTFREEYLLLGREAPALLERRMALIMAHELAHQWFGNLVTMQWWDDIWLNEGFATWMQAKTCDDAFPGFGALDELVLSRDAAMRADTLPAARPVRQIVDEADEIHQVGGWSAYQKGAAVLGMLESWKGPDAFRTSIRAYVDRQADKSITSEALFAALSEGEKLPVSKVARSFLDQPGVPLVELSLTCDASTKGPVKATLKQFALGGPPGAAWSVPVCVDAGGAAKPTCALLAGAEATLELERCPAYVHPNAGEAGYYRYDLDQGSWAKLVASFAKLPEVERAGLLLDAWALVVAGRRGVEDVVALLRSIDWNKETSRVVIESAISVLGEMHRTLVDDATRPAFAKLVRRVLDPSRKRLGIPTGATREPAGARLLRVSVLAALHELAGDREVGRALAKAAAAYVEDPAKAAALVGPDLGPLAARVAAAEGSDAGKAIDLAALSAARSPDHRVGLTAAMASTGDPARLLATLELLRAGSIRSGDVRHVKNALSRDVQSREVFYRWAAQNLQDLSTRLGGASILTHTVGWACGKEPQVGEFVAAIEKELPKLEGARRAFEEGKDEMERCGRVRDRERSAFAEALSKEK